ncbi:hypothetical protein SLEP1_g34017 [Rubroshorea leprosula]|uniref:Uncharacterized protein n=1 Tax=Rubroshorea leprosula TaxID=152421 RepID=A0AAV5KIG8_9ROSI|nr:hypothetical protein SLEP1_g34017 [Rubroshorea leprosula]
MRRPESKREVDGGRKWIQGNLAGTGNGKSTESGGLTEGSGKEATETGATQKCGEHLASLEGYLIFIAHRGEARTVGGSVLSAKYPEGKDKGVIVRRIIPSKGIVHGKSYADALRGHQGRGVGQSEEKKLESPLKYEDGKSRAQEKQKLQKSGLVWKQKNRGEEWSGLEFKVKNEEFQWLQGSFVGVAHSVEIVPNLQEKFYMEGYFSCRLRAMGGKLVLLDGEDKDEIKDLVEGALEWLGQWFSENSLKNWH